MSASIRLIVNLRIDTETMTPLDMRDAFIEAIRSSIIRAHAAGRVETMVAEELFAALPARKKRQ